MKKTNFDRYLAEQMRDRVFAERFAQAGEAWDLAVQITVRRERADMTQTERSCRRDRRGPPLVE